MFGIKFIEIPTFCEFYCVEAELNESFIGGVIIELITFMICLRALKRH